MAGRRTGTVGAFSAGSLATVVVALAVLSGPLGPSGPRATPRGVLDAGYDVVSTVYTTHLPTLDDGGHRRLTTAVAVLAPVAMVLAIVALFGVVVPPGWRPLAVRRRRLRRVRAPPQPIA